MTFMLYFLFLINFVAVLEKIQLHLNENVETNLLSARYNYILNLSLDI